jgi:hypothetical protein
MQKACSVREDTMYISATSLTKYAAQTALFLVILLVSCAVPEYRPGHEVKFIVIGNTSPVSPFTGYPERLPSVYRSISHENIVLAIHTGNMIHGGHEWMGITRKDIVRQYQNVIRHKNMLTAITYILAGEMDQFNGKIDFFEQFISKKLFYSFNYADSHFILLNILNKDHVLTPGQMRWLENDLEAHKNFSAIFVFSHYPVISSPQSGIRFQGGEELHALFIRYPVKAVISGSMKNYSEYEKDTIRYIDAGCYGFNNEDWQPGFNQYYIARYDGINFSIKGVKVNVPPNLNKGNTLSGTASEKNKKN